MKRDGPMSVVRFAVTTVVFSCLAILACSRPPLQLERAAAPAEVPAPALAAVTQLTSAAPTVATVDEPLAEPSCPSSRGS